MSIRLGAGLAALATLAGSAAGGIEAARAAPAEPALPQREADCDLAPRDAPTLDVKRLPSARFRMVVEPIGWGRDDAGEQHELVLRHGEETATLREGVRLRVSLGGCEDYSNQYVFSIPGAPPNADGAYWLRRASVLVKEIEPASRDRVLPLRPLADALIRASRDPRAARDLLGSGWEGDISGRPEESYVVQVERRGSETVLTVNHYLDL